MAHPSLPIVPEKPAILVDDPVRELLRQRGPVDEKLPVARHHLVPARQDEGGKVCIVIEMVVREDDRVDLGRTDAVLD